MDTPKAGFRQRIFAWALARFNARYKRFASKHKQRLFKRLGMPIEVQSSTGDALPLADESADAVISTLVLCCVNSQQRALQEGGRLLFIEHVAAPEGSWLRRTQNLLTPLWKRLGDGCYPNRETSTEVVSAGFENVDYVRITAPTFIVSPQIVGIATKSTSRGNIGRASTISSFRAPSN